MNGPGSRPTVQMTGLTSRIFNKCCVDGCWYGSRSKCQPFRKTFLVLTMVSVLVCPEVRQAHKTNLILDVGNLFLSASLGMCDALKSYQ